MHPLDLLKVKLQVSTTNPTSGLGRHIWLSLKGIHQTQGLRGLYRGLIPNIAGNASSWGLYFLLWVVLIHLFLYLLIECRSYNMLKKRASDGDLTKPLSASQYLICSAEASSHSSFMFEKNFLTPRIFQLGAITAVITNPLWLVRVRMFTTTDSPNAYRGLWGTSLCIYSVYSIYVFFDYRWLEYNFPERRNIGFVSGDFPCLVRCQQWRDSIRCIREDEDMGF